MVNKIENAPVWEQNLIAKNLLNKSLLTKTYYNATVNSGEHNATIKHTRLIQ